MQDARAAHAARRGMGLAARADDVQGLMRGIAALADPDRRAQVRDRCAVLPPDNGADRIADWLAGLARLSKPQTAAARTVAVAREIRMAMDGSHGDVGPAAARVRKPSGTAAR
jgi:hypothetical protein